MNLKRKIMNASENHRNPLNDHFEMSTLNAERENDFTCLREKNVDSFDN